jgi:hypothetical protein
VAGSCAATGRQWTANQSSVVAMRVLACSSLEAHIANLRTYRTPVEDVLVTYQIQ